MGDVRSERKINRGLGSMLRKRKIRKSEVRSSVLGRIHHSWRTSAYYAILDRVESMGRTKNHKGQGEPFLRLAR